MARRSAGHLGDIFTGVETKVPAFYPARKREVSTGWPALRRAMTVRLFPMIRQQHFAQALVIGA